MAAASYYSADQIPSSLTPTPFHSPIATEMAELPVYTEVHPQPYSPLQTSDFSTTHHHQTQTHYDSPSSQYSVHSPHKEDENNMDEPDIKLKPQSHASHPHYTRFQNRWKRLLRWVLALSSFVSTVLDGMIFGIMLYVNITFFSSRNSMGEDGAERIWPPDLQIWPEILLLVASFLGLGVGVTELVLLYKAHKQRYMTLTGAEDKTKKARMRKRQITVAKYACQIGVWVIVSSVFIAMQGENDLWGFSCSEKARAAQTLSDGEGAIDFGTLCSTQVRQRLGSRGWWGRGSQLE